MAKKMALLGRFRRWVIPSLGALLASSVLAAILGYAWLSYLLLVLASVGSLVGWAQAEHRARHGGDLSRLLFDRAPFGVALMDPERRIQAVNPALVRMVGAGSERRLLAYGKELAVFRQPAGVEASRRIKGQQRAHSFETSWRSDFGRELETRIQLIPVLDARGKQIAIQGLFEDVSEHNRALRALRESDERFQEIAESAESGMFLIDYEGNRLLYGNRGFERMLGESLENLRGNFDLAFSAIHPEDRESVQSMIAELEEAASAEVEFRVQDAQGGQRWTRARCVGIRNEFGRTVRIAGTLEDLSQVRELERELSRLRRASDEPPTQETRDASGASLTVMLAESDELTRHLAQDLLSGEGYRVLSAEDGAEALGAAARHEGPIELLVSGMAMPRMDGVELSERLREVRPGIQIILLSDVDPLGGDPPIPDCSVLPRRFKSGEFLETARKAEAIIPK